MSKPQVYWDPFHMDATDPYPMLKRLREEAPLYYNEEYDFYALSRYDDCEIGLTDRELFSSAKGSVVSFIKNETPVPPGMFIFTDAPTHTVWRSLFGKMFTPRNMKAIEPQIRAFTRKLLDPLVEAKSFDFAADFAERLPMQVIGMLLGIPEADLDEIHARTAADMRNDTEHVIKPSSGELFEGGAMFKDYIDWRVDNPSDDLMTQFLNLEFEDETGVQRKLTRTELLIICSFFANAGNETTAKLIGWMTKVLADHPDQRRQLAADRSLIPQAIEETLRFESISPHVARVTTREAEYYGQTIPKGSCVAFVTHAANRDERVFANPDVFDIHRERKPHMTFGYGWHVCLGNPLARLEARVAFEEIFDRFPEWEIDTARSTLIPGNLVRGFDHLPTRIA